MKTGIAYGAFTYSFIDFFPDIEIVDLERINEYSLIIFSGGADINPAIYGEENRYSGFNPRRDEIELNILKLALESNIKIIGICRGHQLINAYLGGKLAQDLGIDLGAYHGSYHNLEYLNDGVIQELFPHEVNSIHHQGVIKVGGGLTPTSSYKGVYESTESDRIISVQWHPEWMNDHNFFDYIQEWRNK